MKCPFCAEDIQEEAIKCRFCGEFLNTDDARWRQFVNDYKAANVEERRRLWNSLNERQQIHLTNRFGIQQPLTAQTSSLALPAAARYKKPTARQTVIVGAALVFVILVWVSIYEKPSNNSSDADNPLPTVSDSSTAPIVDPFQQMSAAGHLAEAKKALGPDRPPDAATEMRLSETERLKAIRESDKEFPEAQKLKEEIERRKRELERYKADINGDFRDHLKISKSTWSATASEVVSEWKVFVTNTSAYVTYKDISFKTAYAARSGTRIDESILGHTEYVTIPPKSSKWITFTEFTHSQAHRAGISIKNAVRVSVEGKPE